MENKVGIILPVYNTNAFKLKRCLNHLNSERFEVIIIDDCSNNLETLTALNEYEKTNNIHIIRNTFNLGAGEARRKGIRYLIENDGFGAKYFGFIDSDDEINEKNYLEFVDEVYYSKASAGLARIKCYLSNMPNIGLSSKTYNCHNKIVDLSREPYMLKMGPSILTCRLFSMDLAKLFDVDYSAKAYEDTEILYFIFALANNIYISNKIIYSYYLHEDSLFFTNMKVTSSNCLNQILLSSNSRNEHFKNDGIYETYASPLTSLELTYYLQRLKSILNSNEIVNKAEIAAHLIKLISIRIPNFEDLFKICQSPILSGDKNYLKYTELNDILNNFKALFDLRYYNENISEYTENIPNNDTDILKSYDKRLVLKKKDKA